MNKGSLVIVLGICLASLLTLVLIACSETKPTPPPKTSVPPATLEASAQATIIAHLAATEAAQAGSIADPALPVEDVEKPTPTPGPTPAASNKLPNLTTIPVPTAAPARVKLIGQLGGIQDGITAAALSPDKNWLALANRYQIWLYEVATGKFQLYYISTADDEERGAASLAWSADGRKLAAGSFHGLVNMWRWDSLDNRLRPGPARLLPYALATAFGEQVEASFSPDGRFIAGLGSEGVLVIWDSETYRQLTTFNTLYAGFFSWSPDSKLIVDEYLSLHILGLAQSARAMGAAAISGDRPQGVAFSPDGKSVAVSAEDFKVAIYSAPGAASTIYNLNKLLNKAEYSDSAAIPRDHLKLGKRVAYSPDSKWLAVANTPAMGKVSLYNAATGQPLFEIPASSKALNTLAWPAPGLLYAAGDDGIIRFWQIS